MSTKTGWRRAAIAVSLTLCGMLPGVASGQEAPTDPPLYDDLGDHHVEVATQSERAQAYFDQGMRLYYAFNHAEAVRAFRAAQRLDANCAMCWWGEGLAFGPNINLPMDEESARTAYAATQEAVRRLDHASPRERGLIRALAVRYAEDAPADRAHLDVAYAEAMGELAEQHPSDHEIRVLHAEALMDLRPWDYWTEDGQPQPGMETALAGLRYVQDRNPEHPGACHFYIHAVEKLFPEDAVPCAERLAGLMPGAGHIVHMPGHIYIRVGRYREAIEANRHAIHADETYITDQRPAMGMYTAGYYPHNYDFLAFASMMVGQGDDAVESALKVAGLLPEELFAAPGMGFLQHWSVRPLLFQVRFARWDDVLDRDAPPEGRPHSKAIWHYARARALAATGDVPAARREVEGIRRVLASGDLEGLRMEFNASPDLIAIAERVATGWVEAADGRFDRAVEALREAVRREDALLYGEPPEWSVPTRQDLGAVLLVAGRDADAQAAFEGDLERFPENGWSLRGLAEALRAQGQDDEAEGVEARLARVWQGERGAHAGSHHAASASPRTPNH